MRTQGSLRLILNTKLWPQMQVDKASEKSVRITAMDTEDQGVKVFLISVCITKDCKSTKPQIEVICFCFVLIILLLPLWVLVEISAGSWLVSISYLAMGSNGSNSCICRLISPLTWLHLVEYATFTVTIDLTVYWAVVTQDK